MNLTKEQKLQFNEILEELGASLDISETEIAITTVWTDYTFYFGGKFSHCGVDAFSLVKTEGSWKIFYLTDTRRKEGCKVPKKIQKVSAK